MQAYQIDNIAWFFISSNSNKPLQLDERDKGNRRFSVIRSYDKLRNGKEIHDILSHSKYIENYLAWLHEKYPEVLKMKRFEALDNQDKLDLEERSQSESNCFWDWYEENFPEEKKKMTKLEVELLVGKYCFENNIESREFLKYFWHHSRYPKKKIRI